jgi:adenylosuccinate synthase
LGCLVVVGGAYGDEGKGKIISYIALKKKPKIAVRGGVGPNAGHTVVHGGKTIKLRMLPSAVVNPETRLLLGPGVLVDPHVFLKEVSATGTKSRARVDKNCGIIQRKHIRLDSAGHLKKKIGTTGTGTGPANADRALRIGKIASQEPLLRNFVENVTTEVNDSLDRGEFVIVEGTQGTMLSLNFGDYPYVTSKDVCASGVCSDVGIGPKRVDDVLVVFKSYLTRVGSGELPGELSSAETKKKGWEEFGSVTGRLRRAAPFNFELAKKAVRLNTGTQLAITKLDVLFPETCGARDYDSLSKNSREFISSVESELGIPVVYIGTGADSEDIIDRSS